MTLEQVRHAKATLEAQGEYASYDRVQELTGGSKRDIGKLMRQLATEAPDGINSDNITVDSEPEPSAEANQLGLNVEVSPSVSPEVVHPTDNFPQTDPTPALGPIWELGSPLQSLWETAYAALETENILSLKHQTVKVARQALDAQLMHLDGQRQARLSPAQAAERREQEASTAVTRRETEEHRVRVYVQLATANLTRRHAEEVYRDRRYQVWALLRLLREHQRQAASRVSAVAADSAQQEALRCQERLAEQVGTEAARQLANDPTLPPQWPGV
jgi:hypothetical protein